nr:hypothetical protein L195_g004257 [Ipomoea trifida]
MEDRRAEPKLKGHLRPSPISFAFALNKCFCIFPVAVFGNGPNITDFGTQYFGIFDRLKLIISPAKRSRSESFTSGFGVTNAQGDSPHCSSGLATTDTSSIAGCCKITRVIPPACKSLLVGLRILQVALHHHVASEHDFSDCLSICRDGLHVLGAHDIEKEQKAAEQHQLSLHAQDELFQKYSLEQYYAIHLEVASMQSLGHRFPGIVRTQLRLSLEHIEVALDHSLYQQ